MSLPKPWGRTSELVRTYKAVNDPNAPPWSIKFVGGIAAFAILLAAGGAVWYAAQADDGRAPAAASAPTGSDAFVEYVGLPPETVVDPAQVDAAFEAWKAQHPDAVILSKEPVREGGKLVGYRVTYR